MASNTCLWLLLSLVAHNELGIAVEAFTRSCSFPEKWSAEGVAFPPVRYFTNIPECRKATIFVHYPSKLMQIRTFVEKDGRLIEAGSWLFRDGISGSSTNIPLFYKAYTKTDQKEGLCDVMILRMANRRPLYGAVELQRRLLNLTPVFYRNGTLRHYEQNFTSRHEVQISLKTGGTSIMLSTANIINATLTYRVNIDGKGDCVPLGILRYVWDGSACMAGLHNNNRRRLSNNRPTSDVEYFFAFTRNSYRPGRIGRYDDTIPQMRCSNNFLSLRKIENIVSDAKEKNECPKEKVFEDFVKNCCSITPNEFEQHPACDLGKFQLFRQMKPKSIWKELCRKRAMVNEGRYRMFHRDAKCLAEHKEVYS